MTKDLSNLMFGTNYAWSHYDNVTQNNTVPPSFIDADLTLLTKNFNTLRTYSIHKWYTPIVLQTASRYQLKVVLEIPWVYGDSTANTQQYELFKYILSTYKWMQDCVSFIFIGHENMPSTIKESNDLITQMQTVQSWIDSNWSAANKPIIALDMQNGVWNGDSTTPGYNVLKNMASNAPVFTNIYPYWADLSESDAQNSLNDQSFQAKFGRLTDNNNLGNREIYIGETGWPSAGKGSTDPKNPTIDGNETDAKNYLNFIFDWLQNSSPSNFKGVLLFEAFDEPFKSSTTDSFDNNWGIYSSKSALKAGINLPFSRTITPNGLKGTPVNFVQISTAIETVSVTLPNSGATISFDKNGWDATGSHGGYPFVPFGSTVELTTSGGETASATLTGGDGIGEANQMNLAWSNVVSNGITSANFANNGVWF